MTALAKTEADLTIADLSLDELLDVRPSIVDAISQYRSKLIEANKALTDYDTMIKLRMEETGSRKFVRPSFRGFYKPTTAGSAKVPMPGVLKAELAKLPEIPVAELEEALPLEDVEPVVKAYLKPLRKLADYSARAAALINAHIEEAKKSEEFTIEEVRPQIDVTASIKAAHASGERAIVLVEDAG